MDELTRQRTIAKWNSAAKGYDLMSSRGAERRWEPAKRRLFSAMRGKILFLAVGTGLDIEFFPPGQEITGIDISPGMLGRARDRAANYSGRMELHEMDVHELSFEAASFDQVYTSCTFCSVPDPVAGLEALRRVLKPGGEMRMFEHTGSRYFPFNVLLSIMSPISGAFGAELNRSTVGNVERAGFRILEVENVYLDVVKLIAAQAPETDAVGAPGETS